MSESPNDGPFTELLVQRVREGDPEAVDQLFSRAYQELRHLARVVRRRGSPDTLNTTALVHEAYFKLKPSNNLDVRDKAHFSYIVARAMRQVMVDAARRRNAEKRGGGQGAITLRDGDAEVVVQGDRMLALDEALSELETVDPRRARVVECRFFGGLSVEETAALLDVSTPTVKRDWRVARAWLAQAIEG